MVYKDQFVAVLTLNGKILRETRRGQEDVIQMPFNSEFGVRLKNLSSYRAFVKLEVDGKNVLEGGIVLRANETHDLEGFMENGVVRNRFKFIQKTQQIAEYRGDFIEDGIVKITYQFEKPTSQIKSIPPDWDWKEKMLFGKEEWKDRSYYNPIIRCCNASGEPRKNILRSCFLSDSFSSKVEMNDSINPSENEGITVKGSETNIVYNSTYLNELFPDINTITFKIIGVDSKQSKIKKPVTTRSRIICSTCGIKNKSYSKYCTNCGTYLR